MVPKEEPPPDNHQDSDSDSSDFEIIPETDSDRRRAMLDSDLTGNAKLKGNNGRLEDFWDEFIIPRAPSSGSQPKEKEKKRSTLNGAVAKDVSGLKQSTLGDNFGVLKDETKGSGGKNGSGSGRGGLALGNIVQDEVEYRKKEALGMTKKQSEGRTLGGSGRSGPQPRSGGTSHLIPTAEGASTKWACLVCTL